MAETLKIKLKNSTYDVCYDDRCIVVSVGDSKIWLTKEMVIWLYNNYPRHKITNNQFIKSLEDKNG